MTPETKEAIERLKEYCNRWAGQGISNPRPSENDIRTLIAAIEAMEPRREWLLCQESRHMNNVAKATFFYRARMRTKSTKPCSTLLRRESE